MDHDIALAEDGFTVFRGVVPPDVMDRSIAYGAKLWARVQAGEGREINDDHGRAVGLWQSYDMLESWEVPELLWLPDVAGLIRGTLRRAGTTGNSPLSSAGVPVRIAGVCLHVLVPGTTQKSLHRDHEHLFGGRFPDLPACALALHVPLADFSPENGATRIIPGTHRSTERPTLPSEEAPDSAERFGIRAAVGDVFLRDPRGWHAAGANATSNARAMISILYHAEWFGMERRAVAPAVFDALPSAAQAGLVRST